MKKLILPNSLQSIVGPCLANPCSLEELTFGENIRTIGAYSFSGCNRLAQVDIPYSVTCIGKNAFASCRSLTSVVLPNGLTSIGEGAFYGCKGITAIIIPNGVKTIEKQTFAACSGLTSVDIPDGVVTIGMSAFNGCSSLPSLRIPASVKDIDNYAFRFCSGLSEIWSCGTVPVEINEAVFDDDTYEGATLYVPAQARSAYEEDPIWQMFRHIKTFDPTGIAGVTTSADGNVVEYYNLNGSRTIKVREGIYIRRANGKAHKVFVK